MVPQLSDLTVGLLGLKIWRIPFAKWQHEAGGKGSFSLIHPMTFINHVRNCRVLGGQRSRGMDKFLGMWA